MIRNKEAAALRARALLDDIDTSEMSDGERVEALEEIALDVKTRLEAAREDLERAP